MQQRLFPVVQSLLLSFSTSRQPIYLVSTFARTLTTHDRNVATSLNAVPVDDLPRVLLKRNRQSKSFRDGNQLVFSGSIEKISSSSSLKSGHIVQVEVPHKAGGGNASNTNNKTPQQQTQIIGWGVYNPDSLYRVRILGHSLLYPKKFITRNQPPIKTLESLLAHQFQKAIRTRQALGLPSKNFCDTYRLVNGEGDGLSGLAVDIVGGNVAVVMSSATWCEIHKTTILQTLAETLPYHELIWKQSTSHLRQDGYKGMDQEVDDEAEMATASLSPVIATENGIKYIMYPHNRGQKTSVYCDQRENRLQLAKLCHEKRVLDLCCYHGGFALNAARHGAASVVGVDSSNAAIAACRANAKLNEFETNITFIASDISEYMENCTDKFDVVVLDPPKLAPTASSLHKAGRKYQALNRAALNLVSDNGGLFMTCTCSAAMTQKDGGDYFLQLVQQASLAARREITLLRVSGASPCHTHSPGQFPAGNYLTVALFRVHP